MPIRSDEYNQVCVLSVDGDLSADTAAALRKVAEDRINGKHLVDFIVDMEKCDFADSEGLETLLWLKRKCDDLFGQMKVVGLAENCKKIFEITRLEPRFECQKDLPAALKTMR